MPCKKLIPALLAFLLIFTFQTNGQTSKPATEPAKKIRANDFIEGKTIIAEVKFWGLDSDYEDFEGAIRESSLISNLRGNRVMISVGEKFSTEKVETIIKRLKEELSARGYLEAEVAALGEKLPENHMRLIFSINRGEIVRVSEIRFTGNENISNEEFVADFKQCSGESWEIFERERYKFYSQMCSRELMFSKGYFQSRVLGVTPRLTANGYVVTIQVYEGIRYRLGEIRIEGVKVFTEKEILEMFGQKQGDVANAKEMRKFFFEKLKRVYEDKGYILYGCDLEPTFIKPIAEGLEAMVNVQVAVDEGPQFKLANIEFPEIDKEKADELRKLFSLKDGEIYNRSVIEEGVKKIDKTKEFYQIDFDRDIEVQTEISTDDDTDQIEGDLLVEKEGVVLRQRNPDEEIKNKPDSKNVYLVINLRKIPE